PPYPHARTLSLPLSSTTPPPPRTTLFPYTTLFRSAHRPVAPQAPRAHLFHPRHGEPGHHDPPAAPADRLDRVQRGLPRRRARAADRKSTRLNSSHDQISYAVFCLKKKKSNQNPDTC